MKEPIIIFRKISDILVLDGVGSPIRLDLRLNEYVPLMV
jgi:hypothetical protein